MNPGCLIAGLVAVTMALGSGTAFATKTQQGGGKAVERTIHDFRVRTIDGEEKSLGDYRGKVVLIVNTASNCGFTPQYEGLEKLYQKYKARGFVVLAFPANNFMGQEPGSNAEIKSFCTLKYRTTFPLFEKISVKGKNIAPLYAYLTKESGHPGDIKWNFAKFIVAPDGRVIARFDPGTDPLDSKLVGKVESALPAKSST